MKTGFKDALAPKKGVEVEKKRIWDWSAPSYDGRTSCYVSAGTNFGVGHKNPVGTEHPTKGIDSVIPKGRVATLPIYEDR